MPREAALPSAHLQKHVNSHLIAEPLVMVSTRVRVAQPQLAHDTVQVILEYTVETNATDSSNGTLSFLAPPGDTIAPPGTYMLFILWQGVPSHAAYVKASTLLHVASKSAFGTA